MTTPMCEFCIKTSEQIDSLEYQVEQNAWQDEKMAEFQEDVGKVLTNYTKFLKADLCMTIEIACYLNSKKSVGGLFACPNLKRKPYHRSR